MKNYKNLKVYCPYSVFDISYEVLKTFGDRVTFEKPEYLEYNTDTSAECPNKG